VRSPHQCKPPNLVASRLNQRKKDLMNSKIISRAACLRELASNPKSFFNCPDLHGGVPDLPEDRMDGKNSTNSAIPSVAASEAIGEIA
jgi:hypothetical protein